MKLIVPCPRCHPERTTLFEVELANSQYITVSCPYGHTDTYFLTSTQHELLFESALSALADGHGREAVATLAAALERYYEFWLKVVAKMYDIESSKFIQAWKQVSQQSERQLGAFIMAYLIHIKSPPELLADRWIKFRNDVIHKGKMISTEEAIGYADAVANLLVRLNQELFKSGAAEAAEAVCFEMIAENAQSRPGSWSGGSFGMRTVLGQLAVAQLPISIGPIVERIRSSKRTKS